MSRKFLIGIAAGAMFATTAFAQTTAPAPSTTQPTAPAAPATASSDQVTIGQGKWRASKLLGVDIYAPDNKKVGDVTEVIFDKSGKIDMVTVGVGGFLGVGTKDVAIPFDQVKWSDMPMSATSSGTSTAPASMTGSGQNVAPSAISAAPTVQMYPDHGMISMTKDQLSSAPAVTYASR